MYLLLGPLIDPRIEGENLVQQASWWINQIISPTLPGIHSTTLARKSNKKNATSCHVL